MSFANGPAAQGGDHATVRLTRAERSIVELLAASPGRRVSREHLIVATQGASRNPLSRSLDVHVARVRRKLRDANAPARIATIRGVGYQWVVLRQR